LTGLRERKKREQRERILDTAITLVTAHGLQATRIEQIAERADISQTTFFNYFPSKADLVDALVDRLLDVLDVVLDEADASGASAPDRVRVIFAASADLEGLQQQLVRDLIAEALRSPTKSRGSMDRMRTTFRDILSAGQAEGQVRDDQPAEALADAVVGLYTGVVVRWTADERYPVSDRLRTMADLAADLVSPR
jgi:AcrR family transcriptional regulator